MKEHKTKVKAVFHFTDGTKHESILSVKSGKHEDIMTSISDQVGKYNVLAFIEKEFTSSQFLIVRENIKLVEFLPLDVKPEDS